MNNYCTYEVMPGNYGQIRFCPLFIANITITKLEEWFHNFKFLKYGIDNIDQSEYSKHRLPTEYIYSNHIRTRCFNDLAREVADLIEQSQFQELVRIMIEALEMINECLLITKAHKIGNTILDLKENIAIEKKKFNKKSFPDKIKTFPVKAPFDRYMEILKSINGARNCYEHRRGIVGVEDCNKGTKKLVIRQRYPTVVDEDGQPVGIFDSLNHSPDIQIVESKLTFRLGDKVKMNFENSYRCIHTIIIALKGLIDHIYDINGVKEQGIIFKNL